MERKVRDRKKKGSAKRVFLVEEWDDRGSETYRFKKFRDIAIVSEVIYLMVDSLP